MVRKFVTSDVFNKNGAWLRISQVQARAFGLRNARVPLKDGRCALLLAGSKLSFIGYYASTAFNDTTLAKAIGRLARVISY